MARILIVDDEPAVRTATARALALEDHHVELATDGAHALDLLLEAAFDLVVLDIQMPRLDGLELVRRLRDAQDRTPVLMVSARDTVDDRVRGLELGADDYLVKPFALRELHARITALLRRTPAPEPAGVLRVADLQLDTAGMLARRGTRAIALTRTEFDLLALLMRHAGTVLHRSAIYERVWGFDIGDTSNTLGVYVGYLRRKLGDPPLIHTVRGTGYVIRAPADAP